jgi:hypothetical protein
MFSKLFRPITSRWRRAWRWSLLRWFFEARHFRRLAPLLAALFFLTLVWSALTLGVVVATGNGNLLRGPAFLQNVIASMLVLPIGLAIGIVSGALLEKHSLRFRARHSGDRLGDCVRLAAFTLTIFLKRDCGVPIDLDGPTDSRFFRRARAATAHAFSRSSESLGIPPQLSDRLRECVHGIAACFRQSPDLRLAFPRAFDCQDRLALLMTSIETDPRSSSPENTTLIIMHQICEMVYDLE